MLNPQQVQEIVKCSRNPLYLAEHYGWMQHPAFEFPIRFIPWDWQEALVMLWKNMYSTIVLKSRQLGFSWAIALFANSVINFGPNHVIPLLSANQDKAMELLSKVVFFYDHMPSWLRAEQIERSKTRFSVRMRYFDNTQKTWRWGISTVISLTTTGMSGAGMSARQVFIDEFALFGETGRKGMDEAAYASIAPTTIHGGRIAMGSTPRGYGGAYHRIWVETISPLVNMGVVDEFMPYRDWNRRILSNLDQLSMVPIKAHYSMCYHDEGWITKAVQGLSRRKARKIREYFEGLIYDSAWRDAQARRLKLSKPKMLQEFELNFEQPGNPAFDSVDLQACYKPLTDPKIKQHIAASKSFFIGVDTAVGISKKNIEPDYHSMTALNDLGIQAEAIHSRVPLSEWAGSTHNDPITNKPVEMKGDVLRFIEKYQPAEVMVEKNGPGEVVINRILPHMPPQSQLHTETMSGAIKPRLVADLQIAFQERRIIITDYFTYQTLMQYTTVGPGKYEASPGFYDDPVVALLWANYLRTIHGAYHIDWEGEPGSQRRYVGVTKEEDMSPEELQRQTASAGPVLVMPESEISATPYDRMTDRRPFKPKGAPADDLKRRRWGHDKG